MMFKFSRRHRLQALSPIWTNTFLQVPKARLRSPNGTLPAYREIRYRCSSEGLKDRRLPQSHVWPRDYGRKTTRSGPVSPPRPIVGPANSLVASVISHDFTPK